MKFRGRSLGRLSLVFGLVLCSLFALSAAAGEAPAEVDLTRADWSVNAPHDLVHNPPSEEAVRSFIGHMTNKVCDPHFADLKHNGTLSLVLADDGGGTADCNYTEIFDKSGSRVEEYELDAPMDGPGVQDINGDGHFEVIVDDMAGRECMEQCYEETGYCYPCRTCTEYWPRIYAWTGSGYTEVSSQYPKYYERELVSLKKQIAAIYAAQAAARRRSAAPAAIRSTILPGSFVHGSSDEDGSVGIELPQSLPQQVATPSPTPEAEEPPDPSELDCLKAEAAKMERFLGISKSAGMSDAIRWANSDDAMQRDFATTVLRDIGTTEALRYEQTLSRDSNRIVAKFAKLRLASWGKAEPPDTFDLVSTVQIAPNPADQGAKSGQRQSGAGQQ